MNDITRGNVAVKDCRVCQNGDVLRVGDETKICQRCYEVGMLRFAGQPAQANRLTRHVRMPRARV